MTQWKECRRKECSLIALWQCGIDFTSQDCHHIMITNLVVCGIHKEDVKVPDFDHIISKEDPRGTHFYNLYFEDISEGVWINPKTMQKEKY